SESAKRGDSIKPGGGAKRNPGIVGIRRRKPTKWATAIHHDQFAAFALSHLRALGFLRFRYPGVRLRFTSGFMLTPAPRVFKKVVCMTCSKLPIVSSR